MLLLGLILIIIGITMIVKPTVIWGIIEGWKSNDSTGPSNFYTWHTRFGGMMMTLAGVGGIIAYFLNS